MRKKIFLFEINEKNMRKPALINATQKTPEKIPSRTTSLFYKKEYIFLQISKL